MNAQQYSRGGQTFAYHGLPSVSAYSPSSGPSDGGTRVVVSGEGFEGGSDYRCRFDGCGECATAWSCGSCVVNATYVANEAGSLSLGSLVCVSPRLSDWRFNDSQASVSLEVSLNSQQYTDTNATERVWVSPAVHDSVLVYPTPSVVAVSPDFGPAAGGTRLVLEGEYLHAHGSHLLCKFNGSVATPATYVTASGGVVCRAGAMPGERPTGPVPLQLTLNGQQFSSAAALSYGYYAALRVSSLLPAAGPIEGGTVIRVDGEGFGGGVGFTHNHTCRFRTTLVSAVLSTVGGQAIFTCVSPAVTPAAPASGLSAPLELTLNGQNFSSDSVVPFQPVPVVSGSRR